MLWLVGLVTKLTEMMWKQREENFLKASLIFLPNLAKRKRNKFGEKIETIIICFANMHQCMCLLYLVDISYLGFYLL